MSKVRDPICGMTVDSDTALALNEGAKTAYFCSRHCLEKYAQQKALDPASCSVKSKRPWYRDLTLSVVFLGAGLLAASWVVPALEPFRVNALMYFRQIWWAIVLGYVLGGMLDRYVPREYISAGLSKNRKSTILSAVLLGFAMSACSHGILALTVELHKKGASTAAAVAFLLASPWANLPITLMLISFFGLKALFIILGALLVAVTTGVAFQALEKKGWVESNPKTVETAAHFNLFEDISRRWRARHWDWKESVRDADHIARAGWALADMTLGWILIGILLSALAGAFIPPELFQRWMGPTVLGLLATLALATVMEVCSEGTAPMAFEIFRQTGAFGNAFVFLMAGVATDLTEIGIVWSNLGKKAALWIPAIAVPQIVLLGLLANAFFK